MKLRFGKFKGTKIENMKSVEETKYLHFLLNSKIELDKETKASIKKQLNIK